MARVGRLAGALLAETQGEYFLVGDLKEPCEFEKEGFQSPGERNPLEQPYVKLTALRPVELRPPFLQMEVEGQALAQLLTERLVIARNGSVSERIWRMLVQSANGSGAGGVSARWLAEIPLSVWQIVKDNVLKCS